MTDETEFHVCIPHASPSPTLFDLLERAFPDVSEDDLRAALSDNAVTLDGDIVRRPGLVLRPGAHLRATLSGVEASDAYEDSYPDAHEFTRGDGWVLIDKSVGMPGGPPDDDPTHPFRYLADQLGVDREAMTPVWPLPKRVGGPWLLAETPADARRLAEQFAGGSVQTTWTILAPLVDPAQGDWQSPAGVRLNYATVQRRNGLAELQITPSFDLTSPTGFDPAGTILQTAAANGSPVIGDRHRGGFAVDGPTRMQLSAIFGARDDLQISIPVDHDGWWPEERVTPVETSTDAEELSVEEAPLIDVSDEVMDDVQAGRPWIDSAAGVDAMDNGEFARLRSRDGRTPGLYAIVDRDGPPAARLWTGDPWEIEQLAEATAMRIDYAVGRRAGWFEDLADCDAFRIVHAEADQLPGLYVDRLGSVMRVTATTRAVVGIRDLAVDHLTSYDPDIMVVSAERTPNRAFTAELVHTGGHYVDTAGTLFASENQLKLPVRPERLVAPGRLLGLRTARQRLLNTLEESAGSTRWLHAAPVSDGLISPFSHVSSRENCDVQLDVLSEIAPDAELIERAWAANGGHWSDLEVRSEPAEVLEFLERRGDAYDGLLLDVGLLDDPGAGFDAFTDHDFTGLAYRGIQPGSGSHERWSHEDDLHRPSFTELQPGDDLPAHPHLPEIAPVSMWFR